MTTNAKATLWRFTVDDKPVAWGDSEGNVFYGEGYDERSFVELLSWATEEETPLSVTNLKGNDN
jgi:hypothetical protein